MDKLAVDSALDGDDDCLSLSSTSSSSPVLIIHEPSSPKGDYRLVPRGSSLEEVESIEEEEEEEVTHPCWNRNWMPDTCLKWRDGTTLLELEAVRFLKFLSWTMIGIVTMHYLVKILNWKHDVDYSIKDMILYDFNLIILDVLVFFVVGRLFRQRAIDYCEFIGVCFFACLYTSWSNTIKWTQHSITLRDMHCQWPWELWVFIALLAPLLITLGWRHAQYAKKQGTRARRLVELGLSFAFFLIPYASQPTFHLHHWYFGWLMGMHANIDVWWSRAAMAWCWGAYINGIAVYGRDPILGCAISFYQGSNQQCSYMECYNPDEADDGSDASYYQPMVVPDWRNCTEFS